MDLAALSTLSHAFKTSHQDKREGKISEAQNHYAIGLLGLMMLEKTGFKDKVLAKQVSHSLLKAVQNNRKAAEPYVALAYLMLSYGLSARALRYLQTALECDPQQADAQALMALVRGQTVTLQRFMRVEDLLAQPAFANAPWIGKYQGITHMRQLLPQISKHALELQTQQSYFQPTSDTDKIESFEAHLDELQDLQKLIELCLHQVKEPASLSTLNLCVSGLASQCQQLKRLLKTAHQLADLHDEIDALLEKVEDALETLSDQPQTKSTLGSQLDRWFFRCDQFANQLEALETHPYNLQAMFKDYEHLATKLTELEQAILAQ
ncbi:MAG: hypothetical protein AB7I41_03900 [Candidatus Sericytochromatia bacterium]